MQGIDVCDTIVLLQAVHAAAEKDFAIEPAECHKCKGCSWSMPQAAGRLLYIFKGVTDSSVRLTQTVMCSLGPS